MATTKTMSISRWQLYLGIGAFALSLLTQLGSVVWGTVSGSVEITKRTELLELSDAAQNRQIEELDVELRTVRLGQAMSMRLLQEVTLNLQTHMEMSGQKYQSYKGWQ